MTLNNMQMTWPPPYILKKHPRAKYVKFRATKTKGLEITVPPKFKVKDLDPIIEKHKNWIIAQLQKYIGLESEILPTHLAFNSIQQYWKISYLETKGKFEVFLRPESELVIVGEVSNKVACKNVLIRWVRHQASVNLKKNLQLISNEINLPYASVTVRNQQTRWGSCSNKKAINLNYKLFFLPMRLLRYVIIHELCHTKHLNHSPKFWQLVAKFDPSYESHIKEIKRDADKHIPAWL